MRASVFAAAGAHVAPSLTGWPSFGVSRLVVPQITSTPGSSGGPGLMVTGFPRTLALRTTRGVRNVSSSLTASLSTGSAPVVRGRCVVLRVGPGITSCVRRVNVHGVAVSVILTAFAVKLAWLIARTTSGAKCASGPCSV